jgi:predicted DNA-binding protein
MEVHVKTETQARLRALASDSGRPTDDLVEDAMGAYLTEVAALRERDALARLRRKSEARRARRG